MTIHRNELRVFMVISALALLFIAFGSPVNADLVAEQESGFAARNPSNDDETSETGLVPKGRRGGGAPRMLAPPRMAAPRVAPPRIAAPRTTPSRMAAPQSTPSRPSVVRPESPRTPIARPTPPSVSPPKPTVQPGPRQIPPVASVPPQKPPASRVAQPVPPVSSGHTGPGTKPTDLARQIPPGFTRTSGTSTTHGSTQVSGTPAPGSTGHTSTTQERGNRAGTVRSTPTGDSRPMITARTPTQPQLPATTPARPTTPSAPTLVRSNLASTIPSKPPATGKPVREGQKPGKDQPPGTMTGSTTSGGITWIRGRDGDWIPVGVPAPVGTSENKPPGPTPPSRVNSVSTPPTKPVTQPGVTTGVQPERTTRISRIRDRYGDDAARAIEDEWTRAWQAGVPHTRENETYIARRVLRDLRQQSRLTPTPGTSPADAQPPVPPPASPTDVSGEPTTATSSPQVDSDREAERQRFSSVKKVNSALTVLGVGGGNTDTRQVLFAAQSMRSAATKMFAADGKHASVLKFTEDATDNLQKFVNNNVSVVPPQLTQNLQAGAQNMKQRLIYDAYEPMPTWRPFDAKATPTPSSTPTGGSGTSEQDLDVQSAKPSGPATPGDIEFMTR